MSSPKETKVDPIEAERQKRVRQAAENIARRTGKTPGTIVVKKMVGTNAVNDFMRIISTAQEEMKKNPPDWHISRAYSAT